jgi:hypothetical protein
LSLIAVWWYIVVVKSGNTWPLILGAFAVVILGVVGAWFLVSKTGKVSNGQKAAPGVEVTSKGAGKLDPNVKYDEATGDLKDGGIANEGTHHIERDGGPSRFVYLTSSTVDLNAFTGKKVQVWGQTLASKKAGWLMDVAKIQIAQ